ncbi:MAG: 1-acyl-sn-glycerol-3-phosphate acyltransferase, partial [Myxococcota bacterium]
LKMLRLALRRWLYRESRVVRGPRSRPYGWVRRQVLESRQIGELVRRENAATGKAPEQLRAEVAKTYDKIAARFSFPTIRVLAAVCRLIWNRIYSGIDVRPQDMDRIREALRTGTPVLVPCHRSHLDYLLLSSLLYEHDVVIPHIVAGDNLSFWPLGAIFRRSGAFFIRRSFTGDRVFPVVFARYLQELVHMEVPVEFFIEGGRSRTGKLLPPKVGVLGMVLDGAAEATRADRDVTFLPIYIGYEQIAEETAYARELSGARKEKESVQQVVKATGVLKNRYGKVYLRVGEPLTAREIFAGEDWRALSKDRRHEILMSAGERILHRINAEAVALPTAIVALAVLAHPRRGLRHAELRARVERVRTFLRSAGVAEGGGMDHVDGILEEALSRFAKNRMVTALEEEHGRVSSIVPERRMTLEYYKNTVLHAFAPAAFYAGAV